MQNDQAGLRDKSFCCPWNMGEIGGLNSGAIVESQVVLLYSSKKFHSRFMDGADLKIQTRCHFQSSLRQWGSILCLNQETYLLFSESSSVNISQSLSQSQLQQLMDLCFRFILLGLKRKKQVQNPICYVICCQLHLRDSRSFQSVSLVWPSLTFLCLQRSERRRSLLSLPVSVA